jgi:hypothetical protein
MLVKSKSKINSWVTALNKFEERIRLFQYMYEACEGGKEGVGMRWQDGSPLIKRDKWGFAKGGSLVSHQNTKRSFSFSGNCNL